MNTTGMSCVILGALAVLFGEIIAYLVSSKKKNKGVRLQRLSTLGKLSYDKE